MKKPSLLDQLRLKEWAARLATDLVYAAPLRHTRSLEHKAATLVRSDAALSMTTGVRSWDALPSDGHKSAWAEDPPSRTRRLVTNVLVATTAKPDEYEVTSYLLITRSRFNSPEFDLISAERRDVLRMDGDSFKLARREIIARSGRARHAESRDIPLSLIPTRVGRYRRETPASRGRSRTVHRRTL